MKTQNELLDAIVEELERLSTTKYKENVKFFIKRNLGMSEAYNDCDNDVNVLIAKIKLARRTLNDSEEPN